MSTSDTVTAVIVTCNSLPSVISCLKRLDGQRGLTLHEIVVVDNASTDGSPDAIRAGHPNVHVVMNKENVGFGRACNQGAEIATGEYLLFLNPDLELDSDAVGKLLAVARSTGRPGLIAGRLRYADGSFQANCRRFPTIANLLFSRGSIMGRLLMHRSDFRSEMYSLPDYDDVTPVPATAATMVMIRRDLFNKVRGFDPRFFLYMEDTDLSLRLHHAGYTNLFVPGAGGVHGFGKGSQIGRFRRSYHHHHSVWKYFLKHVPNGFSLFLLPLLLAVNLLAGAVMPRPKQR